VGRPGVGRVRHGRNRGASPGVTLADAGLPIALDRAGRRVFVLLARAEQKGASVIVPGAALAQAMRDPSRQARLPRQRRTQVAPLDGVDATDAGRLHAASDIADAT
jgi:hypothetical protein